MAPNQNAIVTLSSEILPELPKHWTVSEVTTRIRGVLEPAFRDVWIQGELSNCRPAASGHVYFSLKDENASISVALFGWGKSGKRAFELKDGLQVLCRGKLSIYPPRGTYQLVAEHVEPLGAGALQIAFEQLKAKLSSEGLFDAAKKRPLPRYPASVAVITSPSGAVIQDMLNILRRRAPHMRVTVIPALVQGDEAARHLMRGIEAANRLGLGEVIVLARGGGSMEDLWCFNDEALARAIASSRLPILSAVGHEIDFTISDFTADLRAPTPSAAAEILSGGWVDALARVRDSKSRLFSAIQREIAHRTRVLEHITARVVSPRDRLREQSQRCDDLSLRLERAIQATLERKRGLLDRQATRILNPKERLRERAQRCDELANRLERAVTALLERKRRMTEQNAGKLDALSPLRVLERGYTLIREEGEVEAVVRNAADVRSGQRLKVTFHDGNRTVQAV